MNDQYDIETLAVRAGTVRSQFNEHSEAMFLTSSFVFSSAAEAAARFKGEQPGPDLCALHQSHGQHDGRSGWPRWKALSAVWHLLPAWRPFWPPSWA